MTAVLTDAEAKYLAHVKVSEQPTWTALARRYNEEFDKEISWRNLRAAMFRETPAEYWLGEIDHEFEQALDNFFDKFGFVRVILYMIEETFKEWKLLHDMYLHWLLENKKLTEEEKEELGADAINLDIWTIERMDRLWDKITAFFFTATDKMKGLNSTEDGKQIVRLFEAHGLMMSDGQGYAAASVEEKVLSDGQISEYIQGMIDKNQADLADNHAKHKAEGRGIYRPIRDRQPNEDGEEDDDSII